ncbi:AAA family ATPase [Cupriavidus sp. WKF15]|uniref:bifunctional aminoglycoside phosphotransferase/ATP-binding protein n=1 Tax=Cupriavidus sp. WKF15 TaxID=3032282 RepID=UPI0023E218C4|nr:bifunctional aminoglycoside phosphotransferase/ATP-binding protein [Cupriavidus sp. WKF15]WER50174.1 AAA family ATPase [Cupriavidus sp. WKF15]
MDDTALTAALTQAGAYPHPVQEVHVIETHISRVFLAGAFAYKVRKPVRFDFVDFSTAQARRADCETEFRLNSRLAPELYLGVVPITTDDGAGAVRVEGHGTPLEYAVKMRRFEQQDLLLERVRAQRLDVAHVDALARRIAAFHHDQPRAAPAEGFGTPARVDATLAECLGGIARLAHDAGLADQVGQLIRTRASMLAGALQSRLRHGHVRECHGDLHLGNIVLLDDKPTPFDCLEFNPGLRWIDTISDLAFPFMDLQHHGRQDLAYRLLDVYLQHSGDYAGLVLLPFYVAMRALVRARVLLEREHQQQKAARLPLVAAQVECHDLLALARRTLARRNGPLILMHGLSGSGKSTVAAQMSETAGMVRVRSDVERKRTRHDMPPENGWYSDTRTERTYYRLLAICRLGCSAGFPMIADATFLLRSQRDRFAAQARRLGVPFYIVDCEAPLESLRARIEARALAHQDPSEADCATLEWQLRVQEPLTVAERACVVSANQATALIARMGISDKNVTMPGQRG